MVNKKIKYKNAIKGKNDFYSLTLTLEWSIRNKISTQWSIGKLKFYDDQ
jgi:hypothetical protein